MAAMAIMVASFRQSLDDWLDHGAACRRVLAHRARRRHRRCSSPAFDERVRALPQVARVDFLRAAASCSTRRVRRSCCVARDRRRARFPASVSRHERQCRRSAAVWVSEAVADLYGLQPGDMRRAAAARARSYRLHSSPACLRDYARQHGALLIDRADYVALTGDDRVNDGALWLAPGATRGRAMRALRALPGGARARHRRPGRDPRRCRCASSTAASPSPMRCEAVAVLIGLFGLSSSLGAHGARAPARVRHAAPPRHDARPDRARCSRPKAAARRARRSSAGPRARLRDQPGAGLRRQPPVVPLEHGAACAVGSCSACCRSSLLALARR